MPFIRQVFFIGMISVLLLPSFAKLGVLIDFSINREFIATVLCINKDKPKSTCNGNCYLSDQMEKAEGQADQQAPIKTTDKVDIVFYQPLSSRHNYLPSEVSGPRLKPIDDHNPYATAFLEDVFRPPQQA